MKKYLTERIGTLSLVLFGCGAALVSGKTIPDTVMAGASAGIGFWALGSNGLGPGYLGSYNSTSAIAAEA